MIDVEFLSFRILLDVLYCCAGYTRLLREENHGLLLFTGTELRKLFVY